MEDGKDNPPPQPTSASGDEGRRSKNLKEATVHLKAEALRRYQLKHKDSLDRQQSATIAKLAAGDPDESGNADLDEAALGKADEHPAERTLGTVEDGLAEEKEQDLKTQGGGVVKLGAAESVSGSTTKSSPPGGSTALPIGGSTGGEARRIHTPEAPDGKKLQQPVKSSATELSRPKHHGPNAINPPHRKGHHSSKDNDPIKSHPTRERAAENADQPGQNTHMPHTNTESGVGSEGQATEGQVIEGQATEGQVTEGQVTEGQATEGQTTEGQATEGQATEGQTTEGQTKETKSDRETKEEAKMDGEADKDAAQAPTTDTVSTELASGAEVAGGENAAVTEESKQYKAVPGSTPTDTPAAESDDKTVEKSANPDAPATEDGDTTDQAAANPDATTAPEAAKTGDSEAVPNGEKAEGHTAEPAVELAGTEKPSEAEGAPASDLTTGGQEVKDTEGDEQTVAATSGGVPSTEPATSVGDKPPASGGDEAQAEAVKKSDGKIEAADSGVAKELAGGESGPEGTAPVSEGGATADQAAAATTGSTASPKGEATTNSDAQKPADGQAPTAGTESGGKPGTEGAEQAKPAGAAPPAPVDAAASGTSQEVSTDKKVGAPPTDGTTTTDKKPAGKLEDESVDGLDPNTRGDEAEIHSESPVDEETFKIPDDFFYNINDHVSRPRIMEDSGLPQDILTLHHSFGYDCHKRANLQMLDETTTIFAAGNIIELLNLRTKKQKYIRSTSGGGIGALTVHPNHTYFAVAEKGLSPTINIYEYPSLKLFRILRGGTQAAYAYVDYSPDGKLLASVGGDPDYMLTLWDWRNEMIVLRSKAFSQDVFRVTFSSELQGQLTSSGTGHIRFWKMAKTFTGLKLQGTLGKFGKTEISDIEGYVELPDGKVLSGCEWGNLIVWDGGLIKVEISRKGHKPCHNGIIQQIIMDEGELMTIGTDGYIKVWDFETVDTADMTDESMIFEMEPMNELKVGDNVQLKSIVKSVDEEEPTMWYAQDASGGIWKLDLSFSFTSMAPEKLVSYHAGTITGCDTSPVSHLVATTGADQSVRVYDYLAKEVLCETRFSQGGCSLLWVPKIVDSRGATILIGFEDGVVRAMTLQTVDGVDIHGRKKENVSELVLKQAFKPHTKNVSTMAIDHKGEILATGSDDKTVFLFNVEKSYEPIGFVRIPSAVTHLSWSPSTHKKNTLLVCCKEGDVIEYASPEDGNFDTSKSFEITGLSNRFHKFKSIKSRLRHEEDLARRSKELEEKRQKEEEERRSRIERGLETESDNGEEEKADEDEEEEWLPFIPAEPSPILAAVHAKDEGKVWLSLGEFDAGYLYEASFCTDPEKKKIPADLLYEPTRHLPMLDSDDIPVTVMMYSEKGDRVIMGMQDGSIRIHPLSSGDIGELSPYWVLHIHDNNYGSVKHIATSFDQKFLFSVGADGNFFTFNLMDQDRVEKKVTEAKAKIPSAKKPDSERRIDDIDDPNAYSIEDAKQKAEHDKMIRLAEEKKLGVKRSIEGLRQSFRKLLHKNNELPEHLLLDRKEFEMDPEIKRELEQQKQSKIDVVRKEMAWEEEKFKIALDKLRTRFKDIVECERIIVKSFQSNHEVSSFRSTKLPDDFYMAKAEMERRKTTMLSTKDGDLSRQTTHDILKGQTALSDALGDGGAMNADAKDGVKIMTTLKGSMGERINKALAKVEEKKRKRAQRRSQWEELLTSKPDDNYEDPADVAAIREAQENMGDYKLKSADDYVVPDHLRMNTVKARAKLLILKDLIHQRKYDFNQCLLALRDKKIGLIEEIKDVVKRLGQVQENMSEDNIKALPAIPEMHPDELPEKKFEYTRETLLKFKKNMSKRKPAGQQESSASGFGGFGGLPSGPPSGPGTPVHSATHRSPLPDITDDGEGIPFVDGEVKETELQSRMRQAEEVKYLYVQNQLLTRVDELIKNFDAELRVLRHEKFKLDIDLKNADLRQVTLFEELLLLKDFEKRENVLAAKVDSKAQEKQDMQAKVIEVQNNITTKKKDIEKFLEKEKILHAQFISSLGENNKFADYLTKVFKKKIKRSKKKTTDGDGSDDESDEESDEDSDWSESEEESESEEGGYDLDACPQGCDQNLYDTTCTLREKRLDIEEALTEEKKNKDAMTKELDALNKKTKVIDNALKQAENELEAFQLEKQRKLNELDVVVTLKLHQIQYMLNGVLPQDLSPCLVFDAPGVTRLVHRIKALEQEKTMQKKQQKEARKKHIQLNKDRKVFETRISSMEDVCNKMMLQKFGRIVDLEKLETVTVNRNIEELKEKLRNKEIQCSTDLQKWEERIKEAREFITQLVRENTQRLDQLNMLLCERKDFEVALDSRQKSLGGEFTGVRKSDVHERQRLIQLVHLQAQEVEALKEEITLLSRKGGHILPPAQPPMTQSATTGPRQPVMPSA